MSLAINYGLGHHAVMGICLDSTVGQAFARFGTELQESLIAIDELND